jgi:probable HAF family extracellular repeat protein
MRAARAVTNWTRACGLALLSLGMIHVFPTQAQQATMTERAAPDSASNHSHSHHHYKLIDLGTFGGVGSTTTEFQQVLNNDGTVVGGADTRSVNPAPNCFNPFNAPDCYVQHAFAWQEGELTDLGTLRGGSSSFPYWINAEGAIAGGSELRDIDPNSGMPEYHAVLWRDRKIHDLGTLGGTSSLAVAVNNVGQVAGFAQNAIADPVSLLGLGTQTRAFLWNDGTMHDLGTLGGADSFAQYVNDRGQVAGVSYTNEIPNPNTGIPQLDPFLWEDGRMKDLGNLGGTNATLGPFLFGLNNRGQVVGNMMLPGDVFFHAFLWDGRKLSDLGTFSGANKSVAFGINDAGEVIGAAWLPGDLLKHAVLWRNGIMTDLGTVDGDPCSVTESINSVGQVVGASQSAAGGCDKFTSAFLWENGGPMVDLNTLVPPGSALHLDGASQINNRGEITGRGVPPGCDNSDVCGHAYVLVPCDEDHPGDQGCDYSLVAETATTHRNPAPVMQDSSANAPGTPANYGPSNDIRRMYPGRLGVGRFVGSPIALSGTAATSGPIATLSPTSDAFSTQPIGTTSATQTVTLKNTGTTGVTITAIAIAGTDARDFAQTHTCGTSLAAGTSCSISVTFKPTASGTRTAALSVTDNASGSPQRATLSGIGTAVKLSTSSLSFGSVGLGATSLPKTLTLTNVGRTTLSIMGVLISGPNAGDFAQSHTCGGWLVAGASCTLRVTFTPAVLGARTATLNVTDNAAGSPQKVALSGMGVKGGKLTGYCVQGSVIPQLGCGVRSDPTECTPGKPAINPVVVECGGPIRVDEGTSCRVSSPLSPRPGVCQSTW